VKKTTQDSRPSRVMSTSGNARSHSGYAAGD